MIISWFVPYAIDVPRVTITHVLGVPVTGKSFHYILGLQLASGSAENALSSACGLLVGALHHGGCGYIDRIGVPLCVADWIEAHVARFIHSRPDEFESREQLNVGATLELQRAQQIERLEEEMMVLRRGPFTVQRQAVAGPGPVVPAPALEENAAKLVEMGFERTHALAALARTGNDFDMAVNALLNAG